MEKKTAPTALCSRLSLPPLTLSSPTGPSDDLTMLARACTAVTFWVRTSAPVVRSPWTRDWKEDIAKEERKRERLAFFLFLFLGGASSEQVRRVRAAWVQRGGNAGGWWVRRSSAVSLQAR